VTETVLHGGDVNVVIRIADTVRRPVGPWSPAVHSLLRHFEHVGFDGAPRFLGIDELGREILSYVEGEPGAAPVPPDDDVVFSIGALLRRMHAAQAGFHLPASVAWQTMVQAPPTGEVVCHNDLFWTNLIFRRGELVGLIDWDLASPAPRLHDVASAARFWVPLRPDDQGEAWGVPVQRRQERLLALCEGYELDRIERPALLEAVEERGRIAIATYRKWGREQRLPGWGEMWDRDQDHFLVGTQRWLEEHRAEIASWLS
jgi:Ser/Thr protein kinase RdoA (MazF antagonist)